jgi:hypothetical protein
MPQSFTSLHYHLVFSTKQRQPLLDAVWRPRLFEYIGGTLRTRGGGAEVPRHARRSITERDRSRTSSASFCAGIIWSGTIAICGIEASVIGGALPPLQGSGQGIQI